MKKLLLLISALFVLNDVAKSQAAPTSTVIVDTLHYYYNKFYFKTGIKISDAAAEYYKSPAATGTAVTHVGSMFENNDSLQITGLEAFAVMPLNTSQATVAVHLYLTNVDPVTQLPVLPAIDSVRVVLPKGGNPNIPIGGNFATTRTLTSNYFVLLRNMSLFEGDTVRLYRTAGATATSVANVVKKHGEGYGVLRYLGQFYKTTNYVHPAFGYGTDYEFCVAPRVKYFLQASHSIPAVDTACVWDPLVYTNNSSKRFTHRMYNLTEFARKWNQMPPFNPTAAPVGLFPADSAITWYFEAEDNGTQDPRFFLPYNSQTNQITFYTDSSLMKMNGVDDSSYCFTGNEFRARFKSMAIYGRGATFSVTSVFTLCTKYCGRFSVGVSEASLLENVNLYPNPSNGQSTISGLNGTNSIRVYNTLGQIILSETTNREKYLLDLSRQPAGSYFVKVSSQSGSKSFHVIRQE